MLSVLKTLSPKKWMKIETRMLCKFGNNCSFIISIDQLNFIYHSNMVIIVHL